MKKKLAELINVIFGFRKFLLMLFIVLIAIIFRLKSLINGSEMVDLIKNVGIAFMGANGIEHIVGAVNAYNASKTSPAPVTDGPAESDDTEPEPKD